MHRTCCIAFLILAGFFIGGPARMDAAVLPSARMSAPSLSGIVPNKIDAGGPNDLTLTAKGSNFAPTSTVYWTMGATSTALATVYISANALQATAPAALLAVPGTAYVTVNTPGASTTKSRIFTLLVTTLKVTGAQLSRDPITGEITAMISIQNEGYLTAPIVAITASTLGLVDTDEFLPISPGDIPAGATATTILTYPGFAGAKGTKVSLSLTGTFTGGSFSGLLHVKLP